MADKDGNKVAKDHRVEVPFADQDSFHVKGSNSLDWGMKKHLGDTFDSKNGNTVVFASDHNYFMGSIAGLEQLNLLIPELLSYVDVPMDTCGALHMCVSPECREMITLHTTSGSSTLNDDLSHEIIIVSIEDCIRMNADYMAVQTSVGVDGQLSSLDNLSHTINAGLCYGIPIIGAVVVDKQTERTGRSFKLATCFLAKLGASIVKTYYYENFEEIVSACPVSIVVAGGKKLLEDEALALAYRSINEGMRGLDVGCNIFWNRNLVAVTEAVGEIAHHGFTDKQASEFYQDATHQ